VLKTEEKSGENRRVYLNREEWNEDEARERGKGVRVDEDR
jgi:hypothetical protein